MLSEYLNEMRANPHTMRKLFLHRPVLNADYMLYVFKPRLSAPGTNRREDEEQLIMYWINFIEMIDGNISLLMAVVYLYQSVGIDALCRDGTSEISRDPRTKRLQTRRENLAMPSKHTNNNF